MTITLLPAGSNHWHDGIEYARGNLRTGFVYVNRYALLLFLSLCSYLCSAEDRIRVACIGDSITFGHGIEARKERSYPAQLQSLLGDKFDVRNFGDSGRGVIRSSRRGEGWRAYSKQKAHKAALAFKPDIVVCNLGINDIMAWRDGHQDEFAPDYAKLLNEYRKLPSKPDIFIWVKLAPLMPSHNKAEWTAPVEMRRALADIAKQTGAVGIDMYTPLVDRQELFLKDGIHPNADGAAVIARVTAKALGGR